MTYCCICTARSCLPCLKMSYFYCLFNLFFGIVNKVNCGYCNCVLRYDVNVHSNLTQILDYYKAIKCLCGDEKQFLCVDTNTSSHHHIHIVYCIFDTFWVTKTTKEIPSHWKIDIIIPYPWQLNCNSCHGLSQYMWEVNIWISKGIRKASKVYKN